MSVAGHSEPWVRSGGPAVQEGQRFKTRRANTAFFVCVFLRRSQERSEQMTWAGPFPSLSLSFPVWIQSLQPFVFLVFCGQ